MDKRPAQPGLRDRGQGHTVHRKQYVSCPPSPLLWVSTLSHTIPALPTHLSHLFLPLSLPASQITVLPWVTSVTGGFVSFPNRNGCGDPGSCLTSACASPALSKSMRNHKRQPERCVLDLQQQKPINTWAWEHFGVPEVNLALKWGHTRPSLARSR